MLEKIDETFKEWEKTLKLPAGVTGRQWAPELIAWLLELPFDFLIDPFGAKVGKGLSGFILSLAPQWLIPHVAPAWTARDTEDMQGIAKHLLAEGFNPKPEDLVKVADAIRLLREGVTYGDWARVAKAFGAKSPEDIKAELDRIARSFQTAFGITPAVAPPAPPAPPPAPLYKETLATTPTPEVTPPAIPGVPTLFRMTSDRFQPPAPPIAKELFKLTLG